MKNKVFFAGILALLLIFGLVLAACNNGAQEVEGQVGVTGEVSLPKIGDPVVTATPVTGGVKLSWPPVADAGSYSVLRKSDGQAAPIALPEYVYNNGYTYFLRQNKDGLYEYSDLVSVDNELKTGASYTYTVIANPRSNVRDIGKWEGPGTAGTVPEKGSQVDKPTVDFDIAFGAKTVTVTVTPPASGNIPSSYFVEVGRINSIGNFSRSFYDTLTPDTLTYTYYGETINDDAYDLLQSVGGTYAVRVTGKLGSGYFKDADPVTVTKKVEPLFGSGVYNSFNGPYSGSRITDTTTTPTTITYFSATLDLSNISFLSGVTYTVVRAKLDDNDKPEGDFAVVNLYRQSSYNSTINDFDYSAVSLTPDVLGNLPATTVYDRTLPVANAKYKYRVRAVKGDIADYIEADNITTVNLQDSIGASITVARTINDNNTTTFAFTPSLSYKGVLGADDKLVVYWLTGDSTTSYQSGGFTDANSISFSKAELEAETPKSPSAFPNTTVPYVFVQARIVLAEGTPRQVTSWSGYFDTNNLTLNTQRIVRLKTIFYPVGTTFTTLTAETWANGNITTAGGEQWFKFTATTSTTNGTYIHASFGALNDLYVQVYESDGTAVGGPANLYGYSTSASRSLTEGQVYYVRVWPYSSNDSGTYQIAFNTSSTAPSLP